MMNSYDDEEPKKYQLGGERPDKNTSKIQLYHGRDSKTRNGMRGRASYYIIPHETGAKVWNQKTSQGSVLLWRY
jgi:hypothetical protein